MSNKIYSFKVSAIGARCTGRICAESVEDAINQVTEFVKDFGYKNARCKLTELKNQKLAMKQWQEKHGK